MKDKQIVASILKQPMKTAGALFPLLVRLSHKRSMKRLVALGLIVLGGLMLTGCSVMAKAAFGIKEMKTYDPQQVASFSEECRREVECASVVASVAQVDSLIRLDLDSTMMQHRAQPVQVLYFDGDSLVFYHINCYTQSGFLSFDWNNYGSFNRFPPTPTVVGDPSGSMTLSRYSTHLPQLQTHTRYTVVIIWTNVLPRVARKAVQAVAANMGGRPDCTVILVNTDRWWVNYLQKTDTNS